MRSCCLGFEKPYLFFIIIVGAMMINAAAGAFAESSEPALQPAVQTLAQKAFAQKTEAVCAIASTEHHCGLFPTKKWMPPATETINNT